MICPNCGNEMIWCEQPLPKYETWWKCPSCMTIKEYHRYWFGPTKKNTKKVLIEEEEE